MSLSSPLRRLAAAVAAALLLAGAGCANSDGDPRDSEPQTSSSVNAQGSPSITSGPGESNEPSAAGSGSPSAKIDANEASASELASALQAAGVPDAQRVAGEIVKNRPYNGVADLAKLRPLLDTVDPATFEKIVSLLQV